MITRSLNLIHSPLRKNGIEAFSLPLRVQMKKNQVVRPGFFVLSSRVELALKRWRKTKKRGPRSAQVFFLSLFGRDSAKLIPAFRKRLALRQFPKHLPLEGLPFQTSSSPKAKITIFIARLKALQTPLYGSPKINQKPNRMKNLTVNPREQKRNLVFVILAFAILSCNQSNPKEETSDQSPSAFKGKISLDVRDSESDWSAYTPKSAPEGAPIFCLFFMTTQG